MTDPNQNSRETASVASDCSPAAAMHKVKVTAYVKTEESRIIEITDEELAEFRRGSCESRIADAFGDDEGEYVESSTSDISGDRWEIVSVED